MDIEYVQDIINRSLGVARDVVAVPRSGELVWIGGKSLFQVTSVEYRYKQADGALILEKVVVKMNGVGTTYI